MNFRSNLGVVVKNTRCCAEEVLEVWVTLEAFVLVGNFSQGGPVNVRESWPEVFMLIVLMRLRDRAAWSILDG